MLFGILVLTPDLRLASRLGGYISQKNSAPAEKMWDLEIEVCGTPRLGIDSSQATADKRLRRSRDSAWRKI
jgi:hypothetical protein